MNLSMLPQEGSIDFMPRDIWENITAKNLINMQWNCPSGQGGGILNFV